MSSPPVLLINPRMSGSAGARLPLSLLHLAAVLEGERPWSILDGNIDRSLVQSTLATLAQRPHALVGVTVMPGPQVPTAIRSLLCDPCHASRVAYCLGAVIFPRSIPTQRSTLRMSTTSSAARESSP